ncbi:amidohydrolase family protein [Amycolatopsis carbonis]|uniref:Amidohydrolase family protein n=1 Tax=Amycolatopsis carbonis TaxID=715471 RepID=A0A9Y2MW54_9PSEU|nr:amidohydrolase family protein [Amycolatopsis sp. 2-15]WIX83575.1 amidohydrolase family protein [Amycolatopsis sp. 2-15]
MIVDAHVHLARLPTLKLGWNTWLSPASDRAEVESVYGPDGAIVPERIDALFAAGGVDRALLFTEHSPRVTGIQPPEDLLPVLEYNPTRFRLVANVNPHLHYPVAAELRRQLDLGAVALKIHPVHGNFAPNDRELYPAYAECEQRGIPVITHTGPSSFPGASGRRGDPVLMDDVLRDFPDLTVVLAHGGRGWSYEVAGFMALARPNVWLDIAGLPPRKLPQYYDRFDLDRIAAKWIFGTDWPASPGIGVNLKAVADLGLTPSVLDAVLGGNAERVYRLT